ncbi:hypothetical protein [Calidithermus chliarophilus]|uniref:hypothetical protein n=1 Tax=Calidithermus chliarophilus TaxID=52023 RepID=UPI000404E403|nr:hypothetical protein [Calidithermus chliarophilus]
MANTNKHAFEGVAFHLQHFDELLNGEQAWRLLYLPATACPCRDPASNAPQKACPHCKGYGYTWQPPATLTLEESFYAGSETRPPVLAYRHAKPEDLLEVTDERGNAYPQARLEEGGRVVFPDATPAPALGDEFKVRYRAPFTVLGHMQGLSSRRDFKAEGVYDHRDVTLTVPALTRLPGGEWAPNPAWEADENDRFVVVDAKQRMSQVLYRGVGGDRLLYAYVYEVRGCFALDPKTYARTDYAEGVDFDVQDGMIVWRAGRGPGQGRPYTVSYVAAPEFWVFRSSDLARHQGGEPLPRRLTLRVWELFPRPGATPR